MVQRGCVPRHIPERQHQSRQQCYQPERRPNLIELLGVLTEQLNGRQYRNIIKEPKLTKIPYQYMRKPSLVIT